MRARGSKVGVAPQNVSRIRVRTSLIFLWNGGYFYTHTHTHTCATVHVYSTCAEVLVRLSCTFVRKYFRIFEDTSGYFRTSVRRYSTCSPTCTVGLHTQTTLYVESTKVLPYVVRKYRKYFRKYLRTEVRKYFQNVYCRISSAEVPSKYT